MVALVYMRNVFLILFLAIFVSACSSQQWSWVAGEIWEEVVPTRSGYDVEYDEQKIFHVPNQRLACEMDFSCNKPLSVGQFERLSDEEKFRVQNGDDLESEYESD